MNKTLAIVGLTTLLIGSAVVYTRAADEPTKEQKLAKFMRVKLDASNQVLEGLVTEDFGLVAQGAEQLGKLSHEEQWRVSNDIIYRQFTQDFQRSVEQLKKDATNETIDAAALTWIKTTMNCIECHKYTKGLLISDK